MSLLQKFVSMRQQQTMRKLDNKFEDDTVTKGMATGSLTVNTDIGTNLIQPKGRYDLLKFVMQNVPSSAQCVNKILESVLSDGIHIVPRGSKSRRSKSQYAKLHKAMHSWHIIGLLEEWLRNYLTYGDGYLYPVPNDSGTDIVEMHCLNSTGMRIRVDQEILEQSSIYVPRIYEYADRHSRVMSPDMTVKFEIDDIIRMKRPNAYAPVYGLAPLEEEAATLVFGIRVLNHNLRFFQNMTKPPLIVKLNGSSSMKQAEEYKNYLDNNYKGPSKSWETMISYGGTEFQELKIPDQTQFMDMLTFVRVQACGLFGVPPSEVGVEGKGGLNSTETLHKDFIKTNINAKKIHIARLLNHHLLPKMGITDWEFHLPPMDAVNEKQRIELGSLAMSSGQMTPNEIRKRNNLEPYEYAWADQPIIGDSKGMKGYALLNDVMEQEISINDAASSRADPNKASGRSDLEGRDREPNESAND